MNRAAALAYVRANGPATAVEILVNFVLPYVVYSATKSRLGDVRALMASSAPPLLWSLAEFIRKRRVDALSLLVLAGIALSLLAFLGGGSVRFLQFRENFVTVAIGLAFVGSAAFGRPLVYELARASLRRTSQAELESFEALRDSEQFRRVMTTMTLVWGFGLIGSAAVSCALLFVVSIGTYLLVSPLVGYGTMGALALWTYWFGRRKRREGDARRAAAAKAASDETVADATR